MPNELKLTEEKLTRVVCDISAEVEMQLQLRVIHAGLQLGRKITRKEYFEKLILDDVAKVGGASLRTIKQRK
jgi:hypothetical protein